MKRTRDVAVERGGLSWKWAVQGDGGLVRAVDVDGNTIDHFALEQDQPGEVVELGN